MLLSTIIPVYNTKPYLNKAVDSIITQQMSAGEHEIILVDDGSTDGSSEVCDEYGLRYPNLVRVIHKQNGGVSSARNIGITEARGRYIHFMDSDDWLIPGAYKYIVDNYFDDGFDYIGFWSVTLDNIMRKKWNETYDVTGKVVYEGNGRDYYYLGNILPFSVMGWYRRRFLVDNEIDFDCNSVIAEDVQFNLRFMMADPSVRLTNSVFYRYEVRGDSTVSQRNPDKMKKMTESYMSLFELLKAYQSQYPKFKSGGTQIIAGQMVPFTSRVLSGKYSVTEFKRIRNRLKEIGVLPIFSDNKISNALKVIYGNVWAYPLFSVVYRKIFLTYVLPRLSRN